MQGKEKRRERIKAKRKKTGNEAKYVKKTGKFKKKKSTMKKGRDKNVI